jgi:hypothetical protein
MTAERVIPQSGHGNGHAAGHTSGRVPGHGGQHADTRADTWPDGWPRPEAVSADALADAFAWLDREFASGRKAARVPVPLLGSDAWRLLTDDEAAKWAAVFQAARAWLTDYVAIGDRVRCEAREQLSGFEAYASERARIEEDARRAVRRQVVKDVSAAMDRRERAANRTDLPNHSGPELIAAAHASWGLAPPASAAGQPVSESCHDPRALEVV